jgi:hypothetical protein
MAFDRDSWTPNKKQASFLAIPTSIKEAFIGGSNGFGKSDVLLVYGLIHKWHENPRFKQVFMRRTFPELKNEIVPRSREIYKKFGASFNKTDMIWTFPRLDQYGSGAINSGAMIFFGHCEDESDVYKYDSMEINLFTPDELTSYTEFIYLYIGLTRVRTSDPLLPAIIRAAGTPGGVGHTFVKKRFVDPYPNGNVILQGKSGLKRIYIHATLADNPHIDPDYKQSLEALPEAEKRAKLYGDWNAFQGQVFDEFRDKHYPDEPENAIHTIAPFDIPAWWPRIVIGDWGMRAMTYVAFLAISPSKRLYLYRELIYQNQKVADWAPEVKIFIDKEKPKMVKFCQSTGQDHGNEHTIQEQISSALDHQVELSKNQPGSRVAGKMLIHEYLRWKPKPLPPVESISYNEERAQWIFRNRGLVEFKQYMASFNPPEPETNIPKLQIFRCDESTHTGHENCCPVMIDTIKSCSYDKKRIEDVAEFSGDDPYDVLRYSVDSAEAYFLEAEQEFIKVQAQEALVAKLNDTNDWTGFYRNMRKIESEGSVYKPVRRYH